MDEIQMFNLIIQMNNPDDHTMIDKIVDALDESCPN